MITLKNDRKEEMKSRIPAGNRCSYSLKIFKSKAIRRAVKTRLYKKIVKPILYGNETCPSTETDMMWLNLWERQILHRPVLENGRWRIKINDELNPYMRITPWM